jgi:Zn-dependent protease
MRGWRIFTIAGIDVEINYSWIFIFVMLVVAMAAEFALAAPEDPAWQAQLAGFLVALGLFGCLLVHELAHSLTARLYGIGVARVTLCLCGGVSQIRSEAPSATSEIVIAAVGPLSSLLLSGLLLGAAFGFGHLDLNHTLVAACRRLGTLNAMLAVFNLLPAFPLDGGRLLRAALWEWWGDQLRSTRVATGLGRVFGSLLVAWGVYEMFRYGIFAGVLPVAVGWLVSGAARQALQTARLREALRSIPVYQAMQPLTVALPPDTSAFAAVHQFLMPQRLPAIPVASDGVITGLLTAEAIRKHPESAWHHLRAGQLQTPLDVPQMVLPITADLSDALDRLMGGEVRYLLVVGPDGALGGIISQELLAAAAQAYGRG